MALVNVMGMLFNEDEVPDFGSIRLTSSEGKSNKDYILNSEDLEKLNLITNAGQGSTALCIDTKELYIKHLNGWVKI